MELVTELNAWQWGIIATVLIVLEMFVPGAFMLWLGIAAAMVGIIMTFVPSLAWEAQFIIFAVVSVASIYGSRAYQSRHPQETDQPALNRRGEQYVGREFTLNEAIVNGVGKLHVDDTCWKISGKDMDAGAQVKITGVNGVILTVEEQT